MKLSEMNSDQLLDAMVKIAMPASNIVSDEELVEYMKGIASKKEENMTVAEKFGGMLNTLLPLVLSKHREDTLEIIAALTGRTVAEVREQNGLQVLKEARGSIDKDLIDFFSSAAGMI